VQGPGTYCWMDGASIGAAGLGGGTWVGVFPRTTYSYNRIVYAHEVGGCPGGGWDVVQKLQRVMAVAWQLAAWSWPQ